MFRMVSLKTYILKLKKKRLTYHINILTFTNVFSQWGSYFQSYVIVFINWVLYYFPSKKQFLLLTHCFQTCLIMRLSEDFFKNRYAGQLSWRGWDVRARAGICASSLPQVVLITRQVWENASADLPILLIGGKVYICKSTTKITFFLSHSIPKFKNCSLRVSSGLKPAGMKS
jgi:hypothetical protein